MDPNAEFIQRRLSEIFHEAADKSTGDAHAKFERVSTAFDAFVASGLTGSVERFEEARDEFRAAMTDLKDYAGTDPAADRLFFDMNLAMLRASQGYDDSVTPPPPESKPPVGNKQVNDNPVTPPRRPGRHYNL